MPSVIAYKVLGPFFTSSDVTTLMGTKQLFFHAAISPRATWPHPSFFIRNEALNGICSGLCSPQSCV